MTIIASFATGSNEAFCFNQVVDLGPSRVHNAAGYLLLAAHGVNGYDAAVQFRYLRQTGLAEISPDFSYAPTCHRASMLA